MKKVVFLMLVMVVFSCSKLEDSRNISFISREANKRTLSLLNDVTDWAKKTKLKKLTPKDSLQVVQEFKNFFLSSNVGCDLLKDLAKTKRIEDGELITIQYSYYKNSVCDMQMPDGTKEKISFKEVAVEIKRPMGEKLSVDLRSLNEVTIATKPDISAEVPIEFSIQKGENIFSHLPCGLAIIVAETFGLPIFRGREFLRENQISPDEARTIIKQRSISPRISIYTEPLYEFSLGGPNQQEWKLNGLSPKDFKEGFSPNFIKSKNMPPEQERRRRR